jgi:hypothetical protein
VKELRSNEPKFSKLKGKEGEILLPRDNYLVFLGEEFSNLKEVCRVRETVRVAKLKALL